MFVLRRGRYEIVKMEYSYVRRSQSVLHTLHWKEVATINTESIEEAVHEAKAAIRDWGKQGYTAERWQIEGRGSQVQVCLEIDSD